MASQDGIIPIKGTIGNITFYKSKAGYLARQKGGISKSRFKTDPAFVRTRENGEEFGRAGKAGKLLRQSFNSLVQKVQDTYMVARMHKEFIKVIQADKVSVRGKRNVIDGEAELMQGFEFNANGMLSTVLNAPYTAKADRTSGITSVEIPPFVPAEAIAAPGGATHYKISFGAAEIDFENGTFTNTVQSIGAMEINNEQTAPISLTGKLTPDSDKVLFLVLCVEFLQTINGALYSLKNGAYNAMGIVSVSGTR